MPARGKTKLRLSSKQQGEEGGGAQGERAEEGLVKGGEGEGGDHLGLTDCYLNLFFVVNPLSCV